MWPAWTRTSAIEVGPDVVVEAGVDGGADEVHVAADAGEILLELDERPLVGFRLLSSVL